MFSIGEPSNPFVMLRPRAGDLLRNDAIVKMRVWMRYSRTLCPIAKRLIAFVDVLFTCCPFPDFFLNLVVLGGILHISTAWYKD